MPCLSLNGFISFRDSFPCPTSCQLQVNGWGLASCQDCGVRQPLSKPGAAARRTCYINPRKRAARCFWTCERGHGPRETTYPAQVVESKIHPPFLRPASCIACNQYTSGSTPCPITPVWKAVQILSLLLFPPPARGVSTLLGSLYTNTRTVGSRR